MGKLYAGMSDQEYAGSLKRAEGMDRAARFQFQVWRAASQGEAVILCNGSEMIPTICLSESLDFEESMNGIRG